MMNKKIVSLLTAVILTLSLFACNSSSDQVTTDSTEYTSGNLTLPDLETLGEDTSSDITSDVTADSSDTALDQPNENGETRLSFVCAGDNIIHEAVYKNAAVNGEYKFDGIYEQILPLVQNADIAYINQETPICGDGLGISGYPTFNSPESLGDFLISSGFDIINLANNHMFDNKLKGFEGMLNYWQSKNVMTVGAYKNISDYDSIRVFEKDGVKIALLAYTDFINSSKMIAYDQLKADGDTDIVIPFTDHDKIKEQIEYAKKVSDLVFVCMHWGDEDEFEPDSSQKKTAQIIADAGADVIIGSHPHVVQDIEWIEGEDGNKTLCIYSLGNLLSTMEPARNLIGMTVGFDIVKDEDGIRIENVEATPVVTYYEYHPDYPGNNAKRIKVKLYLLENFTEEMALSHGYNDNESKPVDLDKLKSYITDNVNEAFLK